MNFTQESIRENIDEAKPLLQKHWEEIAHFKDIPLDPDYDEYFKLEELGITRTFISRSDEGNLIGYAVFFVRNHLHYKNSIQAVQDIIFIHPKHRGTGGKFVLWCDEQLRKEGVNVVHHHVKKAHNWGALLERHSYEITDLIYSRRL